MGENEKGRDMSKQCKCEHWQMCQICMPHRFDEHGTLLPPEQTPLQAALNRTNELELEIEALKAELAATPEQSLDRYRNAVLEEAAKVCDEYAEREIPIAACAATIRAMKEPE